MDYGERETVVISGTKFCVWLWIGMIVFGATALHAEEFGRLFFNAAERKAMNEKRASPKPKPIASVPKKEGVEPEVKTSAEVRESVRLLEPKITGKVIRSSGNNTIWVNHAPNYLPNSPRRPSGN